MLSYSGCSFRNNAQNQLITHSFGVRPVRAEACSTDEQRVHILRRWKAQMNTDAIRQPATHRHSIGNAPVWAFFPNCRERVVLGKQNDSCHGLHDLHGAFRICGFPLNAAH